ncbi:MAG: ferrochelatase, partial [Sphingomonadales bacterium]|nr:ferrochelatase [Sphingomonadales bacterium]
STEKLIVEAGKKNEALVVLPVSFVSEHSETLVELDVEYKQLADQNGVPAYLRVPALGTHPSFIEGLADMIKEPANHSGTGHKHD